MGCQRWRERGHNSSSVSVWWNHPYNVVNVKSEHRSQRCFISVHKGAHWCTTASCRSASSRYASSNIRTNERQQDRDALQMRCTQASVGRFCYCDECVHPTLQTRSHLDLSTSPSGRQREESLLGQALTPVARSWSPPFGRPRGRSH